MVSKTELRVFIASPAGLDEERNAIQDISSTLNATLSDLLDVVIIVKRYEQMSARAGRPQSQINSWVDECDLMIAIVHRRWGSLSGEGEHTGFSEEFHRGLDHFQQHGSPAISLYFKSVDRESEADPGPQLQKVIDFRKSIQSEHKLLYESFNSAEEFRTIILKLLVEEMHKKGRIGPTGSGYSPVRSAAESEIEVKESISAKSIAKHGDIAEVLEAFVDALRTGDSKTPFDVDRLNLFALAVARDDVIADPHLLNRLYLRSNTTDFSQWELYPWLKAYVADHGRSTSREERIVPFVLAAEEDWVEEELQENAVSLLTSQLTDVSQGTLRLLTAHKIRPEELWNMSAAEEGEDSIAVWTQLAKRGHGKDLVEYWASVAQPTDAPIATKLQISGIPDVALAGQAAVSLLKPNARIDPIVELDPELALSPHVSSHFNDQPFRAASSETLLKLLRRTYLSKNIRIASVREIAERNAWTSELIADILEKEEFNFDITKSWKELAQDLLFTTSDLETLTLVFEEIKKLDTSPDLPLARLMAKNSVFREHFSSTIPDHLEQLNLPAYFALHANESSHREMALQVINGEFSPSNDLVEKLRKAGAEEYVLEFMVNNGITAALAYLAKSQQHIPNVALEFLREKASVSGVFQQRFLRILEDVAEDRDIAFFLTDPHLIRRDPECIYRLLSVATLQRLDEMLNGEIPELVPAALRELNQRGRLPSLDRIKPLLRHPDTYVRMTALEIVAPQTESLNELIEEYTSEPGTYYYDVVCELDRLASGSPEVYRINAL